MNFCRDVVGIANAPGAFMPRCSLRQGAGGIGLLASASTIGRWTVRRWRRRITAEDLAEGHVEKAFGFLPHVHLLSGALAPLMFEEKGATLRLRWRPPHATTQPDQGKAEIYFALAFAAFAGAGARFGAVAFGVMVLVSIETTFNLGFSVCMSSSGISGSGC
jgi:hypothetical protein